jgi:hypothetical protein
MIPARGIQTQKGHPRFFTKRAEVIAPMNMKPACPKERSPVVARSHMLVAMTTLIHIIIMTCR